MAILYIPDQERKITRPDEIRTYLNERGIWFDQWEADVEFGPDADQDTILNAYSSALKPFMEKNGYRVADVINVNEQTPNLQAVRDKFNQEHRHTEDEVRFFVDGEGYFWFHLDEESEPVFYVLCQAGDLISVPANTRHWFELGYPAFVKAIRMFIDQSGWVPHYTGDAIAGEYNQEKHPHS